MRIGLIYLVAFTSAIVTAGVHCNLVVNPRTVEAQVQGAAVMGLSMCLPGSAITLKDGEVKSVKQNAYFTSSFGRLSAAQSPEATRRSAFPWAGRETVSTPSAVRRTAPARISARRVWATAR